MPELKYTFNPEYVKPLCFPPPSLPWQPRPPCRMGEVEANESRVFSFKYRAPAPELVPMFHHELVNAPGKCIIGALVKLGPGAETPPHRHGGASVMAWVVSGSVYNKMNDEPLVIKNAGESWYEAPGCHHKVSANTSKTEPASILAIFIVDTEIIATKGFGALVVYDEEWRYLQPELPTPGGARPQI